MRPVLPSFIRLRIQIFVWRHGLGWPLAGAFTLLLLLGYLLLPNWLHRTIESQSDQLRVLKTEVAALQQQRLRPPAPSPDLATLQTLHRVTLAPSEIDDCIQRIYALARKNGLEVAESEFQRQHTGYGGLVRQQIGMPLRGSYRDFRRFADQLLLQMPGVSLDQVHMRREAIGQGLPETRIKLSVWINPSRTEPASTATASRPKS